MDFTPVICYDNTRKSPENDLFRCTVPHWRTGAGARSDGRYIPHKSSSRFREYRQSIVYVEGNEIRRRDREKRNLQNSEVTRMLDTKDFEK